MHLMTSAPRTVPCPAPDCDIDNLHPCRVVVNAGGIITTVNDEGTTVTRGEPDGRGVVVSLYFTCECGNTSKVEYRFHKGSTTVDETSFGVLSEDLPRRTIWRD